jgi:hypothetical protein
MKTVILDANELSRDWLCTGLKYQLLEHMPTDWMSVYVPAVVFEEVVANHRRVTEDVRAEFKRVSRQCVRLGPNAPAALESDFDYRAYLTERFDERLGFIVLPWPDVLHQELVRRAVDRTPPFDSTGGGYRDSLIWADVASLARDGHEVALVTADKGFAGKDGGLAGALQAEINHLPGSVELVRDFGPWLTTQLPWNVESLADGVASSRDSEFYDYVLQSDLQTDLSPSVEELGLQWPPYALDIVDVEWGGGFVRADATHGPGALALVHYDLDQVVTFDAEFPEGVEPEPGWEISETNAFRRVQVNGEIRMIVRLVVLFGGDFRFSVDEVSWRRADRSGPGFSIHHHEPDPNQLSLLDDLDSA